MSTTIIGLGFKARHGKDYVASQIVERYGHLYNIHRYSFADPLKREVEEQAQICGGMFALYNRIVQHNPKANIVYDINPTFTDPLCPSGKQRSILQWWGTEFRRAQDPFYWVRRLAQQIADEAPQFALITDVRFLNEFLYVKSRGGFTVHVERLGFQGIATVESAHASENQLDNVEFDYKLSAFDGDTAELDRGSVELFEHIIASMQPQFEEPAVV